VINSGLAAFLLQLYGRGQFSISIYNGIDGVALARNTIVRDFLKTECDNLWFFDYDCQPWMKTIDPVELVGVDGDIVGGVYPLLRLDNRLGLVSFHYICGNEKGHPIPLPENDVAECHYVGMGCTIIRRHVLEDPAMCVNVDQDPPAIFQDLLHDNGERKNTEDFEFCDRARKQGYTVKVHTGVQFGHVNKVDLQIFHSMMPQLQMRMRTEDMLEPPVGHKPRLVMP
jgi:hypothetical protein